MRFWKYRYIRYIRQCQLFIQVLSALDEQLVLSSSIFIIYPACKVWFYYDNIYDQIINSYSSLISWHTHYFHKGDCHVMM